MAQVSTIALSMTQEKIEQTIKKERPKLLSFIRKRVSNKEDAEDILQDVFFQFTEGYGMIQSIDKVTSWLFSVARNKIIDLYRKKKPENFSDLTIKDDEGESHVLYDFIPDMGSDPEDLLMRSAILEQIEQALEELPAEQRDVFVMHELEDKSFKEIAELTGASINTLLSRKRYAVLYLRERLKDLYNEI